MQKDDQAMCWAVLEVCGAVPPALQDFFKSTVGLLFGFLLGYTFYALMARQQTLYNALFEETAVLTQLLEESQMFLPRSSLLPLVRCVREYIRSALNDPRSDGYEKPCEQTARVLRSPVDAVEEMSRILVCKGPLDQPRYEVLASVRALRQARARRLAAMQCTVPEVQYSILTVLAVLAALPPFLDANADSSTLSQVLYGILVAVLAIVLVAVRDLGDPESRGAYGTERERSIILDALEDAIAAIEIGPGRNTSSEAMPCAGQGWQPP